MSRGDGAATPAETMVAAMAREAAGCELVAQGIATPLVTAALLLARRCLNPDLVFAFAIGNSFGPGADRFSLVDPEASSLSVALGRFDFCEGAGEFLPHENPAEFFRPAQVDPTGATNNVCLGPHQAPTLRLPGAAGIPDVSPLSRTARLYVPRHSPRVFVRELDFRSGAGSGNGPGPVRVFTNLCTMVLRDGRLGLEGLMPGVSAEEVREATGFPLAEGPDPLGIEPPDPETLRVLRREVDPLNLRDLDFLPMKERFRHLHAACRREQAEWTRSGPGW
jgi:acyl CoA:acetate/3-ketoacid CoA transferase beta subunit